MNKNIRKIIAMTLVMGAVSSVIPANNFGIGAEKANAAVIYTYDKAKFGQLKELSLYQSNGLSVKLLKDGFYDKEVSSLGDTTEYYAVVNNSNEIKIKAEAAEDGFVVKAFTSNDKDANGTDLDDSIRIGSGTQTIYLRTYRSEDDYKYAVKSENVKNCEKTYVLHVRNTNNSSTAENYRDEVYLQELYLSDCDINFSRRTTNYYLNVDEDVDEILLRATPNDNDATVEVDKEELTEDDDYERTLKLEKGDNTFKIVVENDDDILTYTLNINRGKASDNKADKDENSDKNSDKESSDFGSNDSNKNAWKKVNGKLQYIDGTGQVMKNKWWFDVNTNKSYYLDDQGYAATGWKCINSGWYYFDSTGAMQTGWTGSGDTWYYLGKSGRMQTGWIQDDSKNYYYLDENGLMQTGWLEDTEGHWYYMNEDGSMAKSTTVGGYTIDANGYLV